MSITINNEKDFFIKEFTKRTLYNYENYNGNYETTHLINSLIGLLVIPKEKHFNSIENNWLDNNTLMALQNCIKLNSYNDPLQNTNILRFIITHLRNAISHGNITINGTKENMSPNMMTIASIKFYDENYYSKNRTEKFEIEIEVELLEKFILEFANSLLQKGKQDANQS